MNDSPETPPEPVPVPIDALSDELLHSVVESFVLREGTDYGPKEFSLDEKVAHVIAQLRRGQARILYDPGTETIGIVDAKM